MEAFAITQILVPTLRQLFRQELETDFAPAGAAHESTAFERDTLLTVQQAAAFVGMSVSTIYRKAYGGELPFLKKGKRLYFYKNDLLVWLRSRQRVQERSRQISIPHWLMRHRYVTTIICLILQKALIDILGNGYEAVVQMLKNLFLLLLN